MKNKSPLELESTLSSESIFEKTTPPKLTNINKMYKFFLISSSVLHIILTIIFFISGFIHLAIPNLIFSAIYIISANSFKLKRMKIIFAIINATMAIFIISSLLLLGWKYNFYLYLFLIIPLTLISCISRERTVYNLKYALIQFIIISVALIGTYFYSLKHTPMYIVTDANKTIFIFISIINFIATSGMSFLINYAFIADVNVSNRRLASINDELNHIATHDPLTSLINRRSMNDHFYKAIDNYRNTHQKFSLILADIDDFKKVNDVYGHDSGDIVLKRVSKIITDNVPKPGVVCRWGGEEILILTYGNLNEAVKLAEQIRQTVASTSFVFNNTYIKSTLTLGVAEYNPDLPIGKVVTQADANLYKGKKSTKNCVVA